MDLSEAKKCIDHWRGDLYGFARFFCGDWLTVKSPKFHHEMYDLLLKELYLLFVAFRGSAKSTLCSMIKPLHCCAFERNFPILLLSLSEDFVINEIALSIRKKIESDEKFIRWFGDLKGNPWGSSFFVLNNGVSIETSGIGGQIRGGRKKLIVVDDVEDEETVVSEDQRKKLRIRITKELIPKLTPDGQIVYVGSNINPLSYINEMLARWKENKDEVGWVIREYQAYRDGVQEKGHELWPEMWPHEKLQIKKGLIGSWAFEAEYMNNPIFSEGNAFDPSTFRYFESLPDVHSLFITIEPAFSEEKTASFGVVMVCAYDREQNLYVDHYFQRQVKSGDLIKAFMNIYRERKSRVQSVGVEVGGPQKGFYQNLKTECQRNGLFPNFVPLQAVIHTPSGVRRKKEQRNIATLQPRFEAGRIYLRRDMEDLIMQLTGYPGVKFDDLVDALAYQYELVQPIFYFAGDGETKKVDEEKILAERGATGYGDDY